MTSDEVYKAYRTHQSIVIDRIEALMVHCIPTSHTEGVWMITKVDSADGTVTNCTLTRIAKDHHGYWNIGTDTIDINSSLFSLLSILDDEQKAAAKESSIYCTCDDPIKFHNMGAGTLDFWVCKRCHKEIK